MGTAKRLAAAAAGYGCAALTVWALGLDQRVVWVLFGAFAATAAQTIAALPPLRRG